MPLIITYRVYNIVKLPNNLITIIKYFPEPYGPLRRRWSSCP